MRTDTATPSRYWQPRTARLLANQHGVALILTLFIVALVTILILEYHFDATVELELADNFARDAQAYQAALVGLQFARTILQKDDNTNTDAPSELWATTGLFGCTSPQQLLAMARDYTATSLAQPDKDNAPASDTAETLQLQPCVSLTIVDEARKLPINALVDRETDTVNQAWQQIFERFFATLELTTDASDPVAALIDWIDLSPGHLEGGAEDEYYATLPNPYTTPDRPMEVPEELALVRHFDCETLAKLFPGRTCKEVPLLDLGSNLYLTPYSDGPNEARVNLNTANEVVLLALTGENRLCVDDILEKRLAFEGQVLSEAISDIGSLITCKDILNFDKVAGVKSTYFRIESVGVMGDIRKRVVAVVKRDADEAEIVYFRVE
jgi:type II secretory pathway component PulK